MLGGWLLGIRRAVVCLLAVLWDGELAQSDEDDGDVLRGATHERSEVEDDAAYRGGVETTHCPRLCRVEVRGHLDVEQLGDGRGSAWRG